MHTFTHTHMHIYIQYMLCVCCTKPPTYAPFGKKHRYTVYYFTSRCSHFLYDMGDNNSFFQHIAPTTTTCSRWKKEAARNIKLTRKWKQASELHAFTLLLETFFLPPPTKKRVSRNGHEHANGRYEYKVSRFRVTKKEREKKKFHRKQGKKSPIYFLSINHSLKKNEKFFSGRRINRSSSARRVLIEIDRTD